MLNMGLHRDELTPLQSQVEVASVLTVVLGSSGLTEDYAVTVQPCTKLPKRLHFEPVATGNTNYRK